MTELTNLDELFGQTFAGGLINLFNGELDILNGELVPVIWYADTPFIEPGLILKCPPTPYSPEYLVIHEDDFAKIEAQVVAKWRHVREWRADPRKVTL